MNGTEIVRKATDLEQRFDWPGFWEGNKNRAASWLAKRIMSLNSQYGGKSWTGEAIDDLWRGLGRFPVWVVMKMIDYWLYDYASEESKVSVAMPTIPQMIDKCNQIQSKRRTAEAESKKPEPLTAEEMRGKQRFHWYVKWVCSDDHPTETLDLAEYERRRDAWIDARMKDDWDEKESCLK